MYSDPLPAQFEVWLYQADPADGYRILPLAGGGLPGVAPGTGGKVTAEEGYADATLLLHGTAADWPDVATRRRVEYHVRYRSRILPGTEKVDLLYRGYIRRVTPERAAAAGGGGITRQLRCLLLGVWSEAKKQPCSKRLPNPSGDDKSVLFEDLATAFVAVGNLASLMIQAEPVGDTIESLDAGRRTPFGTAVDRLRQGSGRIASGGDVDPGTGADRIFFRPYDDLTATPRHKIVLSSQQIARLNRETDDTQQCSVLTLRGGKADEPNLLGAITGDNTGFEFPVPAGDIDGGNLVPNYSFEDGSGATPALWSGTGSRKDSSGDEQGAYRGTFTYETDTVGEYAEQQFLPGLAIKPGNTYTIDVRALVEVDTSDAEGEVTFQWLDSIGDPIGSPIVIPVPPATGSDPDKLSASWQRYYSADNIAPVGATLGKIRLEMTGGTGGSGQGILWDAVRVYDQNLVVQAGWESRANGGARLHDLIWDQDTVVWQDGYSPEYDAEADDADGQDVTIQPLGGQRREIVGGATYKLGILWRKKVGSPDHPMRIQSFEYDGEGAEVRAQAREFTVTEDAEFVRFEARHSTAQGSKELLMRYAIRGDGQGYFDGAYMIEESATSPDSDHPEQFLEGESFLTTIRAEDLFDTGGAYPDTALHAAAVALGEVPDEEDRSEITNQDQAEQYARAVFEARLPIIERPNLESMGVIETSDDGQSTATMMPGESTLVAGESADEFMPQALCLAEKSFVWDGGKLVITPHWGTAPRDPYREITEIVRDVVKQQGSSSASARTASGGGYQGSLP